jgi:hypothetical protein
MDRRVLICVERSCDLDSAKWNIFALFVMAYILCATGTLDKALNLLDHVIFVAGKVPLCLQTRGRLYLQQGQIKHAMEDFMAARHGDITHALISLSYDLAKCYAAQVEWNYCRQELLRFVKSCASFDYRLPDAYFMLALVPLRMMALEGTDSVESASLGAESLQYYERGTEILNTMPEAMDRLVMEDEHWAEVEKAHLDPMRMRAKQRLVYCFVFLVVCLFLVGMACILWEIKQMLRPHWQTVSITM